MAHFSVRERVQQAAASAVGLARRTAAAVGRARREGLTPRQRKALPVIAAALAVGAGFCALMAWVIASIAADPSGFAALVHDNLAVASVAYALVNTLQVFAAFIPGEPLELVAGYLFGTWGGLAVVSAGLALGEALVFVAVRRYGARLVYLFVSREKVEGLALFRDPRRLNVVAFLMMLIPGTPKDIVTYIVGLTPMGLTTWMAISVPARTLSIVASTVVGAQAAADNWGLAALVFALTCVVSVFGMAYYVLISRQARSSAVMDELARREWEDGGRRVNDAPAADPATARSNNTAATYLRDLGLDGSCPR